MIDIKLLRTDPDGVRAALAPRGLDLAEVDAVIAADASWRDALARQEEVRALVKSLSSQVGQAKRSGDEAQAADLAERSRAEGERESELGVQVHEAEALRRDLLLRLPNLPGPDCPVGGGPGDNRIISWWAPFPLGKDPCGQIESHYEQFQRVPHWEIGDRLGILDMERAAKLSGSMFPMFRAGGASLVRALVSWSLSRHGEPGPFGAFEEVRPPTLVKTETMVSTGALPKFVDDAYHLERDDLWAIPTAEVPLTSLARDEILDEDELPKLMTAHTSCFRREAGSAGRDTRGLLRVHEFDKVEILALATPQQASAVHDELLRRAEGLVSELGLAYRVVDLCTGDLGNSAARTFDIEVYAPGCGMWLEVSSVSWFSDYQARRANVRYRPGTGQGAASPKTAIGSSLPKTAGAPAPKTAASGGSGDLLFVHTLNGSAVAVPRIWAALVETYRQPDGSVIIPECLLPFMGGKAVIA